MSTDDRPPRTDHHVTTHVGERRGPDDKDSQVTRIIQSFFQNPVGAIEVIGFICGLAGMYYFIQDEIKEAKSDSEGHYTQLVNRIDTLATAEGTSAARLESLMGRGDVRYTAIMTKLSGHDTDIARIGTGVDFLVRQYDKGGKGMLPPMSGASDR